MIPRCDISAEFYIFLFSSPLFLKQKLSQFYSLPRERVLFSKERRGNKLETHSIIFKIWDAEVLKFVCVFLLYPVS